MLVLMLFVLFVIIAGYLVGSNMTAIRIAGKYSVDINQCGSGNAGSTNILRTFGWKWGLVCLISDCAKGAIAVFIGKLAFILGNSLNLFSSDFESLFMCEGLLGALLGHLLPVFHNFRGGKCVAVAIGGMLVIAPTELAIGMGIGIILVLITKMVSVGSIFGTIIVCSLTIINNFDNIYIILLSSIAMLVILLTHIPNIQRILAGNERRLGSISWDTERKTK